MEASTSLGKQPSMFIRAASGASRVLGTAGAFGIAIAMVLVWAMSGPFFHFSDTWELVINTGTTIVTFLMVFLIQNTQNRDSAAIQAKLDELIRVTKEARNDLVAVENKPEEELEQLREACEEEASAAAGR